MSFHREEIEPLLHGHPNLKYKSFHMLEQCDMPPFTLQMGRLLTDESTVEHDHLPDSMHDIILNTSRPSILHLRELLDDHDRMSALLSVYILIKADIWWFVLFPLHSKSIWDMYKLAKQNFWNAEGMQDVSSYLMLEQLAPSQSEGLVSSFVAFTLANDSHFQARTLLVYLISDVQLPEAHCFFGFTLMQHGIHLETASAFLQNLFIDAAIKDTIWD
ncbi:hypothetical protein EW146_g8200 [Bondarzewia mesenterica]|uniref:Uncharacterized protein n=1 Tax=Bondarzewia mesenterica TaxID=1095465 RepID=A0A4V3XDT6_9AGAM|nr:hypothetical protein EW146_g8200 [Bondarzewia mesenterica]